MSAEHRNDAVPAAWVLCEDERLCRFFEIELAHLGLETVTEPSPDLAPVLVIVDTDAHAPETLPEERIPPACPLLAFGYTPVELPSERDVYLRRPFPLAALEAALRRLSASAVRSPLEPARPSAHTDGPAPTTDAPAVRLEPETMTVTMGDFAVTLTPAEWSILRCLYDRRGETVTREELASLLGGGGNSVEVYICHLRRRLEKPLGRRLIATVRGKGYLWK